MERHNTDLRYLTLRSVLNKISRHVEVNGYSNYYALDMTSNTTPRRLYHQVNKVIVFALSYNLRYSRGSFLTDIVINNVRSVVKITIIIVENCCQDCLNYFLNFCCVGFVNFY